MIEPGFQVPFARSESNRWNAAARETVTKQMTRGRKRFATSEARNSAPELGALSARNWAAGLSAEKLAICIWEIGP